MVTRHIGSGRTIERGELATRVQDFRAHYTGGDFRHTADHVDMNPPLTGFGATNVQDTLEEIAALATGGTYVTVGDVDGYAVGKYNVDSSNAITFEIAMAQAISDPELVNGGIIFILPGNYTINTTITIPAGISIFGSVAGTYIIGRTSDTPMFIINSTTKEITIGGDSGSGPISIFTGSSVDQNKFYNLVLFDSLNSNNPSMTTSPMISIKKGANVLIEQVSFFGKITNAVIPRTKTQTAIKTATTGTTTGTILTVRGCFIDGVATGIIFSPELGNKDYLSVENCRARTFGTESGSAVPATDAFISASACHLNVENNFYTFGGSNNNYLVNLESTSGTTSDLKINISGNRGNVRTDGSTVVLYNNSGLTLTTNISGNNFGTANESGWYIVVGGADGYGPVGDIYGPGAIDKVVSWAAQGNLETTVIINPGTYTVGLSGTASSDVSKLKLIGNKKGKQYPILQLRIVSSTTDDMSQKFFTMGNHIESIYFKSFNSVQSIRPGFNPTSTTTGTSAHTLTVKDCIFLDTTLFLREKGSFIDQLGNVSKTNIIIEDCQFKQSGAFSDSISLITPLAHQLTIRNCYFSGYGYAANIGNTFFYLSDSPIFSDNVLLENIVCDLTGFTIDDPISSGGGINQYFSIFTPNSQTTINNCQFLTSDIFASTSTINNNLLDGTGINLFSLIRVKSKIINIKNSYFHGSNQTIKFGSELRAFACLLLEPGVDCNVDSCLFTGGGVQLQIAGDEPFLDFAVRGGININNCDFSGCINTNSICQLSVDINIDPVDFQDITVTNCNFNIQDLGPTTYPSQAYGNSGAWFNGLGIIQIYAKNYNVRIDNNNINSFIDGYVSGSYDHFSGIFVNNCLTDVLSSFTSSVKVTNNNIYLTNIYSSANANENVSCIHIISNEVNVSTNTLQFNNSVIDTNFAGCLVLDVRLLNLFGVGLVQNNYFSRAAIDGTEDNPLSGGYIRLLSTTDARGSITNNAFSSTTIDGSSQTLLLKDTTVPWEYHTNKNQVVTVNINGEIGYRDASGSGASLSIEDINATDGDITLSLSISSGVSSAVNWYIPLAHYMPPGSYIVSVKTPMECSVNGTSVTTDVWSVVLYGNGSFIQDNTTINFSPDSYVANTKINLTLTPTNTTDSNTFVNQFNSSNAMPKLAISGQTLLTSAPATFSFYTVILKYTW